MDHEHCGWKSRRGGIERVKSLMGVLAIGRKSIKLENRINFENLQVPMVLILGPKSAI